MGLSEPAVAAPRQEIIDLCLDEVRRALPLAGAANLLKATVIKESAATFSPQPGVDRWRPTQQTSVKGMYLAVCPGSDLTAELLSRVANPLDRIVIVGGSEASAEQLCARYGLTNIHHYDPPMGFISDAAASERCLRFIETHSPFRFCFLAVGSPQQERIAALLRARGRARGLGLCVGASLNFLTGAEKRAPQWVQRLALEWLYRLGQDPRRLARRYLVRGPRIFRYLRRSRMVLRERP